MSHSKFSAARTSAITLLILTLGLGAAWAKRGDDHNDDGGGNSGGGNSQSCEDLANRIQQAVTDLNNAVRNFNTMSTSLRNGITQINTNLTTLTTRTNGLGTSLAALTTKTNTLQTSVTGLNQQLTSIANSIGDQGDDLQSVVNTLFEVGDRLTSIEERLDGQLPGGGAQVNSAVDTSACASGPPQCASAAAAASTNRNPVAVTVLVNRGSQPVTDLDAADFSFTTATKPMGAANLGACTAGSPGCGSTNLFQNNGNGVYTIWVHPTTINWRPGSYVTQLQIGADVDMSTLVSLTIPQ